MWVAFHSAERGGDPRTPRRFVSRTQVVGRHVASRSQSLHGNFYARSCWTRWPRSGHGWPGVLCSVCAHGSRLPSAAACRGRPPASDACLRAGVRCVCVLCACVSARRVRVVRVCGVCVRVCDVRVACVCGVQFIVMVRAFSVQEAGACGLQSRAQNMLRRIGFSQQFNMGYACFVVRTLRSASFTDILRFKSVEDVTCLEYLTA